MKKITLVFIILFTFYMNFASANECPSPMSLQHCWHGLESNIVKDLPAYFIVQPMCTPTTSNEEWRATLFIRNTKQADVFKTAEAALIQMSFKKEETYPDRIICYYKASYPVLQDVVLIKLLHTA